MRLLKLFYLSIGLTNRHFRYIERSHQCWVAIRNKRIYPFRVNGVQEPHNPKIEIRKQQYKQIWITQGNLTKNYPKIFGQGNANFLINRGTIFAKHIIIKVLR